MAIRSNKITYVIFFSKPSADWGTISLVNTCTENGLSDGTSDMIVNDTKPSASTTLLALFKNWTTIVNKI